MATSPRAEALKLAGEFLDDIELARIRPMDVVRKASRLARILDDGATISWLRYEIEGYPAGTLSPEAWAAAQRSNRMIEHEGNTMAVTGTLGRLDADIAAARIALEVARDPDVSISSSNLNQLVMPHTSNQLERKRLIGNIGVNQAHVDKILGAIHGYVADRYQELRFGSAVETAFEVVRHEVDAMIHELVPDALPMLSAAFENATSDQPEHWANAASTSLTVAQGSG